jgi:hypothetical protein
MPFHGTLAWRPHESYQEQHSGKVSFVPASVWARQQPTWQRALPGLSQVAWLIRILESIHHP